MSSPGVTDGVTLPVRMGDNVGPVLPTREVYLNLRVQRFYWSSVVACPGGWPRVPAPPKAELITGTKAPSINHTVRLLSVVQRPQVSKGTLIKQEIPSI